MISQLSLPNGLSVSFLEESRRYFGDYYHVKIKVICRVPVSRRLFADDAEYKHAREVIGSQVEVRRLLEKQGVASADVNVAVDRLIADFRNHSLPYFSTPRFAEKAVMAELQKRPREPASTGIFFQP